MRGLFGLGTLVMSLLAAPVFAAGAARAPERSVEHGKAARVVEPRQAKAWQAGVRETLRSKQGERSRRSVDDVTRRLTDGGTPAPSGLSGPSIGAKRHLLSRFASPDKASSLLRALELHVGASGEALTEVAAAGQFRTRQNDVLASFEQHRVWKLVTRRRVEFFRVHGEYSDPHSPWFACCETQVNGVRRFDGAGRALPPTNTQTSVTTVQVPEGTTLYVGIAADMRYTLPGKAPVTTRGGAFQIFSPDLASKIAADAVVRHEYRRRPLYTREVPAGSSDGKPLSAIEVRLDLPPAQRHCCLKDFEVDAPAVPPTAPAAPTTPGAPAALPLPATPAKNELAPPMYWFDQISLWVRRVAARPS